MWDVELSGLEARVLRALEGEWLPLEEVVRRTGLDATAVMRAIMFLGNKNLVEERREEKEEIEYTERGRRYLEEGLPERRLLEMLKEGEREIGELSKSVEGFSAALGLLKKEGIVEVEGGRVRLVRYVEVLPWEEAFRTLDKKWLDLFLKRGLIRKRRVVKIYVRKVRDVEVEEGLIERITPEIIRSGVWRKRKIREYDVEAPVPKKYFGSKHFYLEFLDRVKEVLVGMGFKEMKIESPVITHFWDLEVLFVPQDHPAADLGAADTYLIEEPHKYKEVEERELYQRVKKIHEEVWRYGWRDEVAERLVLRSHITTLSARTLLEAEIPGKYFAIARAYRPEQVDAKHLPEFNQLEGIVLDENINFRDLLGLLKEFAEVFVGTGNVKFKAGYFPFTEPSVEMFVRHPSLGWIEVGGAGIFREELTQPFGIEVPVIAWGLGLERFFMTRYHVHDIRDLFAEDLEKLRRMPKIWRV